MSDPVSVFRFIDGELESLRKFRDWWLTQQTVDPDKFPTSMHAGEWDEQLRIWQDRL